MTTRHADQSQSPRSNVQRYRQLLSDPIESEDTLLNLLLAPLDLLGLVPRDLPAHVVHAHASWDNLNLGDGQSILESQNVHHWIAEVQVVLLEKVFNDWQDVLENKGLYWSILRQWLVPDPVNNNAGAVQIASLEVLTLQVSKHMSARTSPNATSAGSTRTTLGRALTLFFERVSLKCTSMYVSECVPLSQRALVWTDILRHFVSAPDRIANMYSGQIPETLTKRSIQWHLILEWEECIHANIASSHLSSILSKFLRSHWFHSSNDGDFLFNALLSRVASRYDHDHFPDTYRKSWKASIGELNNIHQRDFLSSIISFIDRNAFQKSQTFHLVNGNERNKPGTEGMLFLAQSTWERSLRVALILDLFIVDTALDPEDTQEFPSNNLAEIIAPESDSIPLYIYSPMMTRLLLHQITRRDKDFKVTTVLLDKVVRAWALRVKRASWEEAVFLTLTLLLLLASFPSQSSRTSSLATSPDFITGVSAHLEHLSPAVRRLGMLAAECVSERGGRGMSFGSKIWDGKGEGREEARVMRAAVYNFSSEPLQVSANSDLLTKALGLSNETVRAPQIYEEQVRHPRLPPKSKRLPEKRPVKKLVETVDNDVLEEKDDSVEHELPSLLNISGQSRSYGAMALNEPSEDSSSESDASDDSDNQGEEPGSMAPEEGKAFGQGVPNQKKKARVPVYINELAPLLRENERSSLRLGLKYGESLVVRKANYGSEVHDNAIDLTLALIGLNNNFRVARFEQRRLAILTSLAITSPERVAPCLAEQYFVHQYSVSQRTAMLNALAFAARRLALDNKSEVTDEDFSAAHLLDDFTHMAISKAKRDGENRNLGPKHAGNLLVNEKSSILSKGQDIQTTTRTDPNPRKIGTYSSRYSSFAKSCFIFPLVNRFWAYMQHATSVRQSRYLGGSGQSILDMPFLLGAYLDTLSILCSFAQNDNGFRTEICPEVLELALTVSRYHLSTTADKVDHEAHGGSRSTVLGAATTLVLILLDANHELDQGRTFTKRFPHLFTEVQQWAAAIFEAVDSGADRSVGVLDRSSRASAAILLRLQGMTQALQTL